MGTSTELFRSLDGPGDSAHRLRDEANDSPLFSLRSNSMHRMTNLSVPIALAIGAACGWAAASGRFDSLLKAESTAAAETVNVACPLGVSCNNPDKSAALATLAAHNQKVSANLQKDGKKPNICIIWGDDIGQSNVSAYSNGLMGYRTPNIDRIAKEGMIFTDYCAEQSCTAGRASFVTGQHGMRTGLTKVGMPGAKAGMQKEDPTIANLLKEHGYATAQIGKNHLGDRNEFLPTVHGFDELYGNLYHLNAEA